MSTIELEKRLRYIKAPLLSLLEAVVIGLEEHFVDFLDEFRFDLVIVN